MLLEMPAIPIPAPILARTMPRAVKRPIAKGPTISMSGSSKIVSKSLTLCITRDMRPKMPHENKNPKPMPKVSFVEKEICFVLHYGILYF